MRAAGPPVRCTPRRTAPSSPRGSRGSRRDRSAGRSGSAPRAPARGVERRLEVLDAVDVLAVAAEAGGDLVPPWISPWEVPNVLPYSSSSLGSSIVQVPSANTIVVIEIPSRAADCISMMLKPAAPSPVRHTTSRPGFSQLAADRRRDAGPEHPELEDRVVGAWPRRRQHRVGPQRCVATVDGVYGVRPETRRRSRRRHERDGCPAPATRGLGSPGRGAPLRPAHGNARGRRRHGAGQPSTGAAPRCLRGWASACATMPELQRPCHPEVPRVDIDLDHAFAGWDPPSTGRRACRGCPRASRPRAGRRTPPARGRRQAPNPNR